MRVEVDAQPCFLSRIALSKRTIGKSSNLLGEPEDHAHQCFLKLAVLLYGIGPCPAISFNVLDGLPVGTLRHV